MEFEEWWNNVVSELGVKDNPWMCDLYARRCMWETTHICGHLFGVFRTTSRCEGLHSMLDFVEQFSRCISQMRSQEALSDLRSIVDEIVLQSPLRLLERPVASVLTREIFLLL
ncbi:hypothetical protein Ahy_A01g001892 [Arachis hypogaea]|uniref:Protein FAR1-RELATED SEQUENCE n=1 Tax=Arachis hypogaea TaxID=3818 RepID=A0A445EQ03_ARAHY|nr:hypothetical protein Ahy_A01g001892 [Arachis hypogaea]